MRKRQSGTAVEAKALHVLRSRKPKYLDVFLT
jgi:hypothetical protein